MADVAIKQAQVAAAPTAYTVPGAQEIVLKSVKATFDGTGAAGAFVPTLQIVEPGGTVMVECALGSSVSAGASVDMSWFPGVDAATTGTTGSGFQFNSGTYGADNAGDWSEIEASAVATADFTQPNAQWTAGNVEAFGLGLNAAHGVFVTDSEGNLFNNGNPIMQLEHKTTVSHHGGEGLVVRILDTTAAPGDSSCIGAQISAESHSTVSPAEGAVISAQIDTGGTASAIGLQASATNAGTGKEIALQCSTSGTQAGANSLAILVLNSAAAPIFEVRNDGTVHILTGGTIHADL